MSIIFSEIFLKIDFEKFYAFLAYDLSFFIGAIFFLIFVFPSN